MLKWLFYFTLLIIFLITLINVVFTKVLDNIFNPILLLYQRLAHVWSELHRRIRYGGLYTVSDPVALRASEWWRYAEPCTFVSALYQGPENRNHQLLKVEKHGYT